MPVFRLFDHESPERRGQHRRTHIFTLADPVRHGARAVTIVALALAPLAGCDDDPSGPPSPGEPASVAIEPAFAELNAIGDTASLEAIVRDANGREVPDAAVAWSTSDTAVAAVDADGRVVARSNGTATIEAAAGDATDAAVVRVEQAVASVEVTPAADTLGRGETARLEAVPSEPNGEAVPNATVVWASSDPDVVAVDASGRIDAIGWGGTATVAATADGVSGAAEVYVRHQILFVRDAPDDRELFLADADGGKATRLTFNGVLDDNPAWSPDGSRIAFARADGGDPRIWAMDADGSDPSPLTADTLAATMPAWSPDGSRIAFVVYLDTTPHLFVMDADGSDPTRITEAAVEDGPPAWRPVP